MALLWRYDPGVLHRAGQTHDHSARPPMLRWDGLCLDCAGAEEMARFHGRGPGLGGAAAIASAAGCAARFDLMAAPESDPDARVESGPELDRPGLELSSWLERDLFVATGARFPDPVQIDVFHVT